MPYVANGTARTFRNNCNTSREAPMTAVKLTQCTGAPINKMFWPHGCDRPGAGGDRSVALTVAGSERVAKFEAAIHRLEPFEIRVRLAL